MENHYGLIELVLVFGLVLGVLGWQLVSVRRELKRDREREKPPHPRDEAERSFPAPPMDHGPKNGP